VLAIEKNSILFTVVFFLHAQTLNKSWFVPLSLSLSGRASTSTYSGSCFGAESHYDRTGRRENGRPTHTYSYNYTRIDYSKITLSERGTLNTAGAHVEDSSAQHKNKKKTLFAIRFFHLLEHAATETLFGFSLNSWFMVV
jgi:hypothetical protein